MIKEYDSSLQACKDIVLIDKEVFNEIRLEAPALQHMLDRRDSYRVFLAYENGEPAAFMGLLYASTLHYEGLWIDLLATRPKFQNLGLATALAQKALEIAQTENLDCVTAIVRPANFASIAVFDKMGFSHSAENFTLMSKEL